MPAEHRVIYGSERLRRRAIEWLGPNEDVVARHFMSHAAEIAACFARPSRSPALVYSQQHLGHHLWNELSGIQRVAAEVPPSLLPPLLINPDGLSEMFGRVDELFPAFAGKVMRGPAVGPGPAAVAHAYAQGWFLLRPSDDFVSAPLRRTLCSHALASPAVA